MKVLAGVGVIEKLANVSGGIVNILIISEIYFLSPKSSA
jgi:hypothetical protein